MKYSEFLDKKKLKIIPTGLNIESLNDNLYPFQKDIVKWALKQGRAAIFADCGLGKTIMQLEWAEKVKGNVIIFAPLAVAQQTIEEGKKFGIKASYCRQQEDVKDKITITNYEMLHKFNPAYFNGVVLDESSILKSYTGKFRNLIIESFYKTPFKLACTATPAPNDFMELGNHSEFLGIMSRTEMLAMFFVHDMKTTQKWRIKGHAENEYWKWISSWAVMIKNPSDLKYQNNGFNLPKLSYYQHFIDAGFRNGFLFPMEAVTLQERLEARRNSTEERAKQCADLINKSNDIWIVWCNLNNESKMLAKYIDNSTEIKGSDSLEYKRDTAMAFTHKKIKVLISKSSIFGFGMNWQHCHNVAFVGLSDSFEQFYQALRRCWRFGQKKEVQCHIILSKQEGQVLANIRRKEKDAERMAKEMVKHMSATIKGNLSHYTKGDIKYKEIKKEGNNFTMYQGDCVEITKEIPTESIDYTIFSPPFSSLYTYSDSDRDMGNCQGHSEFFNHFQYLVKNLYRITKAGHLVSFHCMNLPTSKVNDGYIGIRDFRGDLIKVFEKEGFIYHSEVCIWKDPVIAMQRTKALGLLHKQIKKDACMSRQGIADYVVTMRKLGENKNPVKNTNESFPVKLWQQYASPIWTDINPSDTLQYRSARDHKDERHICPLQLEVIRRCIKLWTNKNDLVLSPFAGIGSEGYIALEMERKFIGIELKRSYFEQAYRNLLSITRETKNLF